MLCGSDSRRRVVLRSGLLLEIVRFAVVVWLGTPVDSAILSIGYGFFIASLVDFAFHREWRNAALAALVPLGMTNAAFGLSSVVRRMTPLTYDGALYALDATLAAPFTAVMGKLFSMSRGLSLASLAAYAMLPGAIAAGLGYEEYNYRRAVNRGVGVNVLLAYTVSGTIAAALYILCPGTGPIHAFPGAFPRNLPDPASVPLGLGPFAPLAPRNAMPSLHVAWAILLARSTARSRIAVRVAAWTFAALTTIATIGSGEHYVVDLIAAAPFLVALEAATAHRFIELRRRLVALAVGVAFFSAWILAVRHAAWSVPYFSAHPLIVWIFTIVTLAASALVALRPAPKG
jgi:hypothetical protein